jgi:hypothetical protein
MGRYYLLSGSSALNIHGTNHFLRTYTGQYSREGQRGPQTMDLLSTSSDQAPDMKQKIEIAGAAFGYESSL